jgi:acetyl-CoA acetyltransferase
MESDDVIGSNVRALRSQTAVVGIGYTQLSKNSGRTPLSLAVEAITAAVADAGLTLDDVDGLATHHVNDSAPVDEIANALGLDGITWWDEEFGGGSKGPVVVAQAALAAFTGAARHIVVYRALNGRSGMRMGASEGSRPVPRREVQFQQPYGMLVASQSYAMAARMHMEKYGTTREQLGAVAIQQRANAALNERAVMRAPISMDDYLGARMIAEPFGLLDCCLETDGACALVLTTTDRARDLRHLPVTLRGWASGLGPDDLSKPGGDLTTSSPALIAPRLFSMADVEPEDIDLAELYDAFSFSVIVQLEDYGFCGKGEGGPVVASGATALGGRLPVNTHGGFLSEGYIHGLNHVCEAVSQLRGDAGARQVPGAEVALVSGQPGYISGIASALVLARA